MKSTTSTIALAGLIVSLAVTIAVTSGGCGSDPLHGSRDAAAGAGGGAGAAGTGTGGHVDGGPAAGTGGTLAGIGGSVVMIGSGGNGAGGARLDAGLPCSSSAGFFCTPGTVTASGATVCGDVAVMPVCANGAWVCPADTIRSSECTCLGLPRPPCACTLSGWVCSDAGIDAGIDGGADAAVDAGCHLSSGCCASDADCPKDQECVNGSLTCNPGTAPGGVCKPRPAAASECWRDADCPGVPGRCLGAQACACNTLCLIADQIGTCARALADAGAGCDPACKAMTGGNWCAPRTVEWVCSTGYDRAALIAAGCTDTASNAIRYCCPDSFRPQCR